MGGLLSQPITDKFSDLNQNEKLKYGASEMQGWRPSMEDSHITLLEYKDKKNVSLFAVFDGHGGDKVAKYCGEHAHERIIDDPAFAQGKYYEALKNGFLGLDEDLLKATSVEPSGCTAVVVLIVDDMIYCANAGDSRAVFSSSGIAIPLSYDHKPTLSNEKNRIYAAGGYVDAGRVNGSLALSRAIGDFEYKNKSLPPENQIVTANPDILERRIINEDEFIVVACDGIWDVLSSQEVVNFVRAKIVAGIELDKICEMLMDFCLAGNSIEGIGCDNMTVIIVALLMGKTEEEWRAKCKSKVTIDGIEIDPETYTISKGEIAGTQNPFLPNLIVDNTEPQEHHRVHEPEAELELVFTSQESRESSTF